MVSYKLSEVLGALLCAASEAQHISDQFTEDLREKYGQAGSNMSVLKIPNAQFEDINVDLRFAVAGVIDVPSAESATAKTHPDMDVFVRSEDLASLPEWTVSTIRIKLLVDDAEILDLPEQKPTALGGEGP